MTIGTFNVPGRDMRILVQYAQSTADLIRETLMRDANGMTNDEVVAAKTELAEAEQILRKYQIALR
jgi:hypothetical protein